MHSRSLSNSRYFLGLAGPCRAPAEKSDVCFLQDDQLRALQSHVDIARNDAAIYETRCLEHIDELQASKSRVLELQQDVELAKSQMSSLQSSRVAAGNETRQLKLSNYRVEKELQESKVPSTRSSYCAYLYCSNVSRCPAQLAHTAHDRTVSDSDVLM